MSHWEVSASIRRLLLCWTLDCGLWRGCGLHLPAALIPRPSQNPWLREALRTCKELMPSNEKNGRPWNLRSDRIKESRTAHADCVFLFIFTLTLTMIKIMDPIYAWWLRIHLPFCYLANAVVAWRPSGVCSMRPLAWSPSSREQCNYNLAFLLLRLNAQG